jgi:hypothetical protein
MTLLYIRFFWYIVVVTVFKGNHRNSFEDIRTRQENLHLTFISSSFQYIYATINIHKYFSLIHIFTKHGYTTTTTHG